jgi:putative transcriptional regulator
MKKELRDELLESVREGGEILRGERKPARAFSFEEPDVRSLREKHGLSQPKFAALMGISVGTLRNWEQGRRRPEGSARVLLRVLGRHPGAVLETMNSGLQRVRLAEECAKLQRPIEQAAAEESFRGEAEWPEY